MCRTRLFSGSSRCIVPFLPIEDAWLKCEAYRHEYNHDRPHRSIGNETPIEFMKAISTTCSPMA